MSATTTKSENGNGNGLEYSAAVMKLYVIGEQISIQNYEAMKNAISLVNIFGHDFPSEMKSTLDVYTYKILKSMLQPVRRGHWILIHVFMTDLLASELSIRIC
jgi:hypothetical protein